MSDVPTVRVDHLTPAQIRAYVIADNKLAENAGWDRELLMLELQELSVELNFDVTVTGFETAEIDLIIGELTEDTSDDADELPEIDRSAPAVTRPGDCWRIGNHLLLCGDALKADSYNQLLGDSKAQVVFTDPPYNVAIAGNVSGLGRNTHREFAMASGEMSVAGFTQFLATTFKRLTAFSANGSIHFICMDCHMSSGLRVKAPQDPDYDPAGTYSDHLYLYTGGVDSYHYAATRSQQWPPNTIGRYRNSDPVLISYLVRLGVEKRGEEYLSFPQRALFDKLGIRTMVIETDPFGNFLSQGYEVGSGRDWVRLGNLYLQDGVWNGERILPEGYAKFVSTVAPAWEADKRPIYGAFFWINGTETFPVPRDAYYMAGAGGQTTLIIPSHDLVVVRMGHYKGEGPGAVSFRKALALLMEAVPAKK